MKAFYATESFPSEGKICIEMLLKRLHYVEGLAEDGLPIPCSDVRGACDVISLLKEFALQNSLTEYLPFLSSLEFILLKVLKREWDIELLFIETLKRGVEVINHSFSQRVNSTILYQEAQLLKFYIEDRMRNGPSGTTVKLNEESFMEKYIRNFYKEMLTDMKRIKD